LKPKSASLFGSKFPPIRRVRFRSAALLVLVLLSLGGLLSRAEAVRVARVIDGDTVRLEDGRLVRYIGIDTPESRRRVGGKWVRDPEPFSRAATDANRRLVEGRPVRLESDVEPRDKYGRILAYVYVELPEGTPGGAREVMVNEELLREGVAQLLTIPPNVRYVERLRSAAAEAREQRRGLWGRDAVD
jgi:micrococcal nuclease